MMVDILLIKQYILEQKVLLMPTKIRITGGNFDDALFKDIKFNLIGGDAFKIYKEIYLQLHF